MFHIRRNYISHRDKVEKDQLAIEYNTSKTMLRIQDRGSNCLQYRSHFTPPTCHDIANSTSILSIYICMYSNTFSLHFHHILYTHP